MIAGATAACAWLAVRLFALLRAQTLWRGALGGAWPLIAAALAGLLAAAWRPADVEPVAWAVWLPVAVLEALLGAVLGALVSLPGEAALGAARASGLALGLARPRAWEALHLALAGALALALDLHRPLLAGLRGTAARWPVGQPAAWRFDGGLDAAIAGAGELAALALGLATPVLLTAAIVELGLGFAARVQPLAAAAPALRPWFVTAAALAALGAAWTAYPESWLRALPRG